jgi:Cu/Ag efflux pump CusA
MSGTAVMLTDSLFCGLAISLLFGTPASSALTLIVVPITLYLLLKRKAQNQTLSEKPVEEGE